MFRLVVVLSVLSIALGLENNDRIVNGKTVNILDYPYQCSLQQFDSHFCGGSVLSNNLVLTAAHCLAVVLDVDFLTVRYGSSNRESGGVIKKAAAYYMHDQYNAKTMQYDVGMVKIQGAVTYSATIKPITLPSALPAPYTKVVVTGWGRMDENNNNLPVNLQAVELDYLPADVCRSNQYNYRYSILKSMICAVGPAKDACQGDSGGPLNILGTNTQIGVVSWGAGCAQDRLPGIYTDLTDDVVRVFISRFGY